MVSIIADLNMKRKLIMTGLDRKLAVYKLRETYST
ncbi:hypothetical protein A2U01_0086479, partial [Trifolium medium]|nr:hypothetical protein [Trifolium medium]